MVVNEWLFKVYDTYKDFPNSVIILLCNCMVDKMDLCRHLFVSVAFGICVITQTVDGKLPDLATLCPYNDFCTTKATKTLQPNESHLIPCCQKCSCDADCQLFGNCCPDKVLTQDIQIRYPCSKVDQYYNAPRNVIPFQRTNVFFHIINDCPTQNLLMQYPRCSELLYLEDYAFVSDPLSGLVYQNKYCAMCNGVKDYTMWYLITNCQRKELEHIKTWEEYAQTILTSCEITPIAPTTSSGYKARCYSTEFPENFDQCNITGKWDEIDKDIEDACEYENPAIVDKFYETFEGYINVFGNPYCKLCNIKEVEDWTHLCSREDLLPAYEVPYKPGIRNMALLINFIMNEETVEETSSMCNKTEIWDPFQEMCITVTCPMSKFLFAGRCQDMYKRHPGETYEIYFRIESNFSDFNRKDIHNIANAIISNEHCKLCQSSIYVAENSDHYLVYRIETEDSCTEEYLIEQVKLMIAHPIPHVDIGPNLFVTLYPELYISSNQWSQLLGRLLFEYCKPPVHIDHQLIYGCPRVALQDTELNETLHDDIGMFTENNVTTVCVDDYFRIMELMNSSDSIKQHHVITLLCILYTVA